MKRIGLILILIGLGVICAVSQDSIVAIPDNAFLYALIDQGVDINGDSLISYGEAEAVSSLNVSVRGISNMAGIEAFVNLDTLKCGFNEFTNLDLNDNPGLRFLDCRGYILFGTSKGSMASLNVTNNTALLVLLCSSNQLTSLDVSNNTSLTSLDCGINHLTSLDVSDCSALENLNCRVNHLTSLNVSNNTALEYLTCGGNPISSLDVSNNTTLLALRCFRNQLTSLDVSNNSALRSLDCSDNPLSSLDISNNQALENLSCCEIQLTSLDVSKNTALEILNCPTNLIDSLDVSNNIALTELSCDSNLLTSLDISNNMNLSKLNISNMPTLNEVCFWTLPPPITSVSKTNSPNVYFADCAAPLLFASDTLYQPVVIEVTSTEYGMIYLVPQDTEEELTAIRRACIDSVMAVANSPVSISLFDLDNGSYWLYARDSTGNISEPEAFIIEGVGVENELCIQFRIFPNPVQNLLFIETNGNNSWSVVITSLNGQMIYSNEMEGSSHKIDLSSFQKGIYFITIRSKDHVITKKIVKL